MLPRIDAEERLNAIGDSSVAFGTVDQDAQRQAISALRRSAGMRRARAAKATPGALGRMGIGVRGHSAASESELNAGPSNQPESADG